MEFSHRGSRPSDRFSNSIPRWPFMKAHDARPSNSVLIQRSPELRRKEGEQRTRRPVNQHSESKGPLEEGRHSYGFLHVQSSAENVQAIGAGGGRGTGFQHSPHRNKPLMSASPGKRTNRTHPPNVRFVPILFQKSFCTGDQKFSGL
jgi:hypothetical protein